MRLGNLVEVRINVRAAGAAPLQTILGFWPALLAGFALRAYGLFHFPFLDEESYLIRTAVNSLFGFGPQGGLAPFWENFLFRVPFWNSQAITPVWWWVQYLARLAVRQRALSTRLPEFFFGVIGLALFFRLARKLLKPPIPALLAWLLAVHDVALWVGTKAQYVESFIFCCAVVIAWGLLAGRRGWRPFLAVVGGALAALSYFFLKGLTLTAAALAFVAARGALAWLHGRRPAVGLAATRALAACALALPLAGWLIAGQAYITAHYQVRFGNEYVQSIGQMIYLLTIGYGTGKGVSLVGPKYFALVIYSQADAWPVSTALALPVLAGIVLAAVALTRSVWAALQSRLGGAPPKGSNSADLALYILISIGLTLSPLVLKGTFGARYHIMYLTAALLATGLVLERCWEARQARWGALMALAGLYVGVMLSWADWTAGDWRPGWPLAWAVVAAVVCGGGYVLARSTEVRRALVVAGVGLVVALSLVRGPFHWGRYAPFEPEPRSPVLAQVEQTYHGDAR